MPLNPSKIHMMPLLLGPVVDRDKGIVYESVEMLSIQYKTEYDATKALLRARARGR